MNLLFFALVILPACSALHFVVYLTLIGGSHLDFLNSMVDELTKRAHTVVRLFSSCENM